MTKTFTPNVLLQGEDSDHVVSAVEMVRPARSAGPPLHVHDFDETFYLLDGELTVQLGETTFPARAGELVFAPRGVPHTLANLGGAPARYLLVCTPAGFERYLVRTAAEEAGTEPPGWAKGPVPEVTTVGGPLAETAEVRRLELPHATDDTFNVLLHGDTTGGAVALVENAMPAGAAGPPLHRHGFDEAFYLVDGALRCRLGDDLVDVGAGELVFAPRDVPHTFTNHTDRPARFLIVLTPAGFEREFARRAARRAGTAPPGWATQPVPEVTVLGPPVGASPEQGR